MRHAKYSIMGNTNLGWRKHGRIEDSRSTSNLYRNMYDKLNSYKKIIRYLRYDFLKVTTRGDKFSDEILKLIDSNSKFLQWADHRKIEKDHNKYKVENIDVSDFMETIEDQIKVGRIKFHNKDIPEVRKGILTTLKVKGR